MDDIVSKLKHWVDDVNKKPKRNSTNLIKEIKAIRTNAHFVQSKDMPPIG
jgi:hypothetical protein